MAESLHVTLVLVHGKINRKLSSQTKKIEHSVPVWSFFLHPGSFQLISAAVILIAGSLVRTSGWNSELGVGFHGRFVSSHQLSKTEIEIGQVVNIICTQPVLLSPPPPPSL